MDSWARGPGAVCPTYRRKIHYGANVQERNGKQLEHVQKLEKPSRYPSSENNVSVHLE